MDFLTILNKHRELSFSEKDKGTRFEQLMQGYLRTSPIYENVFETVWLWSEFPAKREFGKSDVGIDLVALTTDNEYWAIQCKCFQEDAQIDKKDVDSFLATSSREFSSDGKKPGSPIVFGFQLPTNGARMPKKHCTIKTLLFQE